LISSYRHTAHPKPLESHSIQYSAKQKFLVALSLSKSAFPLKESLHFLVILEPLMIVYLLAVTVND